ncbi:hypothetical protein AMS68_004362 [Peltaster fructicola]|uniref:eIF-2-alpha kinase activator GCN1 n=1 Tax=Peltaster fructicola TaxID=286661 RepID=A0A6H0XW10_9PEZI|nr:hypothetical protein AMS68_004362 [Peltaster fructicola]
MTDTKFTTDGQSNGVVVVSRQELLSTSTKRRTLELSRLNDAVSQGIDSASILSLLEALFSTYPRFIDSQSRQAVETCLSTIAALENAHEQIVAFARHIEKESVKTSIAPGNAFVLIRWSSRLLQNAAGRRPLFDDCGMLLAKAMINALDTLLGYHAKEGTTLTAYRTCWRAFRAIFKSSFAEEAINSYITLFTTKSSTPMPKNALALGMLAGVAKRLPTRSELIAARRKDFVDFYLREILGSKVVLPDYLGNAMQDFFAGFVSQDALQQEIIPTIEKALLRAPEVVLNDLVAQMVAALPASIDLSDVMATKLTKPLISNVKSSNANVRSGVLRTFSTIAKRCHDADAITKVTDEILVPLKTNKVPAADQRVLYAQLLSSLPPLPPIRAKITDGIAPVASKEANESAAAAEIAAIVHFSGPELNSGVGLSKSVLEAFSKGIAEKRLPIRKVWIQSFCELVWTLADDTLASDGVANLFDSCLSKLLDVFNEVYTNPTPAIQNGHIGAACAITALVVTYSSRIPKLQASAEVKKAAIADRILILDPKPSFLLSPRIYTKLVSDDDVSWFIKALAGTSTACSTSDSATQLAWAQAVLYIFCSAGISSKSHALVAKTVQALYLKNPSVIAKLIVNGIWKWCEEIELDNKESAAVISKTGTQDVHKAVKAICPREQTSIASADRQQQMGDLVVLCQPSLLPRISWIDLCLQMSVDPGKLATEQPQSTFAAVFKVTEHPIWRSLPAFQKAAYSAAAELAFVAPDAVTSLLLAQITQDLNAKQLDAIGPTEAAIYRTPEGVAFVDVLTKQSAVQTVDKNTKDYDTLKWEQELRAQLEAKKGSTKKLTPEEQAKVKTQLAKESDIRKTVASVDSALRRGIGFIQALVHGPPTQTETWFGPSIQALFEVIQAGAGLLLGNAAALAYIACSDRISARLGANRPFVGVATLRAAGLTVLPEDLLSEPLGTLVTRVLYRLRFLGEQRPFDAVTFSYALPLVFLVLQQGGIGHQESEAIDEQILLAIEFVSFHTDTCTDTSLPRQHLLDTLIQAMQQYPQHFREVKDCFTDLCRCLAPSMSTLETDTVVRGTIVADSSVRNAVLQAISTELDLSDRPFYQEIWIECFDDNEEHIDVAKEIWDENTLHVEADSTLELLPYLERKDVQLRRASARSLASAIEQHMDEFEDVLHKLQAAYLERAKPRKPELDRYGLPKKQDLSDPWEARHGFALAFRELARVFPASQLVPFMNFLIESGPLSDANSTVRDSMVEAASAVVTQRGKDQVEALMKLCETTLEGSSNSQAQDLVNEAVVILYGALAQHLPAGDERVPKVVQRLLATLSTPSESVQFAVANCLPPLGATENKKAPNQRQGAYLAFELLSLLLGQVFEPYVIQIVPQLLTGFGDASIDVREACLDASKTCFASLSSFGVKRVLPTLLEGLEDQQWRSKKGACESLGAMAYLDPQQLAISLPEIIPPLTEVLNDSHKEVRSSANRSLQRFGEVITNPEVKSQVSILLKALSDPTKYTDEALDALIKVNFVHYLDAPSLALVVRILERGLGDRSATKRKASQIIGSLAHLTERKDLVAHLPILVAGLRVAIVDPVPTTRATASKALGSTVEKLGEDALPDLIPSLMRTLRSDTGAGDRLGSAQALSEVLAGLGTARLEDTLPTILQNVASPKASVREGFMSLFIYLPACFGNSFANYLAKVIPPILAGLADDVEAIRETALRAGRLLVKNFATRAIDLLLPELDRGLGDDSHRIRLSSVELVGDLLFNLTGISGKAEQEDYEENANEAGQSLLEVLGEEKRNKILSSLYICRNDTSGLVRTAAINVWKALVSSPRTLRELIPTLTQLLIRRLASNNMEHKVIAGNALGELIRKAGEGVLATLLPTLEEGLQTSTDTDARQGICIALRELVSAASPEALEDYEQTLISVVRTALVDSDDDVRDAAAEAFDALQKIFGKRAVDQVLPHLLNLLRSEDEAQNALSALLTLLTETTRSNIILPNLLPTLLKSPISSFNAKALASLAEVAGSAMTRRLQNVLNSLMDNIIRCKDESLRADLDASFDAVILSVDEFDGLNTMMSIMLGLVKNDDHHKRASASMHLAKFFQVTELDFSRYYPDLIRTLLLSFGDGDIEAVKAAWTALSALTQRLRKEEMESLVVSTRQTLNQVGMAGHNLPGFSLPKGINAILPIFLQGLMNGSAEQRTQAALAISDLVDRTSPDGLKPFVTQITGPLIRVVSERSTELKAAILLTLNNLLDKIPTFLKPFLPQLQRTFVKSLADPASEVLRSRAAKALGTLITMTPRIDPLIAELVTGSKTAEAGVRNAMLSALYEVVSKAGANMNEVSRNAIIGLIDSDVDARDDAATITYAKLLGALIKVLPQETATPLIKTRVVTNHLTPSSVLALNAVLLDSPQAVTVDTFAEITPNIIVQGMSDRLPLVSDNCVLAAGKWLLTPTSDKSPAATKLLFEALANAIAPGGSIDTRRLALVVIRTVSRENNDVVRPHLPALVPPIFGSVRDPVIPIKLSAEGAFLSIFDVVEEDSAVFDAYMAGPGGSLPPGPKRSIQEYFKRIALKLSNQVKERREAEGGSGGLGLTSDEQDDEREVWSVGRVDLGDGTFSTD